ncbi:MAG TPA: HEPN domain-containing protein [Chloroflexota bacterium]|nr:HEPN domain-containing protein [Chloroflexota bacterium]
MQAPQAAAWRWGEALPGRTGERLCYIIAVKMDAAIYLAKAEQCLAGAELAVAYGQYNNAANRAYYAAFQAAIAVLCAAGIQPPTPRYWAHDFVLREYCHQQGAGASIWAPGSGAVLKALQDERLKADYDIEPLGAASGRRALALAREFVAAVRQRLGGERAW